VGTAIAHFLWERAMPAIRAHGALPQKQIIVRFNDIG
jgi:hypothetical protein